MHLIKLQNKNILLAPYNIQSVEFADYLDEQSLLTIAGFLDKQQKNSAIYPYETSKLFEADFIVILSPNYAIEITKTLLHQNIAKEKIIYALAQKGKKNFIIYTHLSLYLFQTKLKYFFQSMNRFMNINYVQLLFLRNKHKKKRAFIIGNGPSLTIDDLEKLQNEITFAANKIYLAYKDTSWRPSYYFVIDKLVYIQNYQTLQTLPYRKFFSIDLIDNAPRIENSCYFPIDTQHSFPQIPSLHANPFKGINKGDTVVYAMAEMALYMGIDELYFIGVDFDFKFEIDKKNTHASYTESKGEVNHFHKEYRKVGEKWNKPNLKGIENSFIKLLLYCKQNNIKVYNATRGGKLEVLNRVDFDSLF